MDKIEFNNKENITENGATIKFKKVPTSVLIIIGLQLFSILLVSYMIEAGRNFRSFSGIFAIPMMVFVYPILGIIGLVQAIRLMMRKLHKKVSIILLLASIFMVSIILPSSLASKISPIFGPIAQHRYDQSIKNMNEASEKLKEMHYLALSESFQKPKRVIDAMNLYLLLSDYSIVKLYGIYPQTREKESDFEKYAKEYLLNKDVKMVLPDHDEFISAYIPGGGTGIFRSEEDYTNKFQQPPNTKMYNVYGDIPVLIFVDGELINARYNNDATVLKYLNR